MNFDFGVSTHKNIIDIDVLPKYITPEEFYLVFLLFILTFIYWLFKILFKIRYTWYLTRSLHNPIILDTSDLYCDRSTLDSIAETHLLDVISCKSRSIMAIPSISIPFTYISEIKTKRELHTMDIYVNKELSIQFFYGVEFKNLTRYIDDNKRVGVIKTVLKPLNGFTDEQILSKHSNNEISFPCLTQVPYSRTIHKDLLNTYMYNNSTYATTLLPLICYIKERKQEEEDYYYQEIDRFDEGFIIFNYKDNSNIQVLSYIILTRDRVFIMKDIFGETENVPEDPPSLKKSSSSTTTTTTNTTNTTKTKTTATTNTTKSARGLRNSRRNLSRGSHLLSESQNNSFRRRSQREIGTVEVIPLGVVNEEKTELNNNNNNSLGEGGNVLIVNTRDVFNVNVTDPLANSHSTSPLLNNSMSVIETKTVRLVSPESNNIVPRKPTNTETKSSTELVNAENENEEKEDEICIICLTNKVNTIFVGCRHKIICDECIKEVDKCPVCRSLNEAYLVIK